MNEFISVFGTALIITSIIGLILCGVGMIIEKTPLKDKLANMFSDEDDED